MANVTAFGTNGSGGNPMNPSTKLNLPQTAPPIKNTGIASGLSIGQGGNLYSLNTGAAQATGSPQNVTNIPVTSNNQFTDSSGNSPAIGSNPGLLHNKPTGSPISIKTTDPTGTIIETKYDNSTGTGGGGTPPTGTSESGTTDPITAALGTTAQGLIANKALSDYSTAGAAGQAIGMAEQGAAKDPNGTASLNALNSGGLATNLGLIGQNALTAAQGEANLAGPVSNQSNAALFSPTTGAFVGGGNTTGTNTGGTTGSGWQTGNTQIDNSVQAAAKILQTGHSTVTDALSQAGVPDNIITRGNLSKLMQQTQPGWTQTANDASASQTINQGVTTGGEAYNLGIALQQVATLQPVVTDFLSKSGINPTDSTIYNAPIDAYIKNLNNSEASAAYATMMNDLQNFSSQIVASGTALTPNGVTAATALQDPSGLSMNQINQYMDTLAQLGLNRYSVLKSSASASGSTSYTGGPGSISTSTGVSPNSTAPGAGITSPVGQGAAGVGLGTGQWLVDSAGNLGGEILGFIAKGAIAP